MQRMILMILSLCLGLSVSSFAQTGQKQVGPKSFSLTDEEGVVIISIIDDSPAEKAGVERGDILLSLDGNTIESVSDVRSLLRNYKAGDRISLSIRHGDEEREVELRIEERLFRPPLGIIFEGRSLGFAPHLHWNNRDEAGNFMEWVCGSGSALVLAVEEDSPADRAGIKRGDVIYKVGKNELSTEKGLKESIAEQEPGSVVEIMLLRNNEEKSVTATLAETEEGGAKLGLRFTESPMAGIQRFRKQFPAPEGLDEGGFDKSRPHSMRKPPAPL